MEQNAMLKHQLFPCNDILDTPEIKGLICQIGQQSSGGIKKELLYGSVSSPANRKPPQQMTSQGNWSMIYWIQCGFSLKVVKEVCDSILSIRYLPMPNDSCGAGCLPADSLSNCAAAMVAASITPGL